MYGSVQSDLEKDPEQDPAAPEPAGEGRPLLKLPNPLQGLQGSPRSEVLSHEDTLYYSMYSLKGWEVFWRVNGTVWSSERLSSMLVKLLCVSMIVGACAFFLMPDPTLLDATKFSGITAILSLFVSLMLSFYISSSVSRWLVCVGGFEDLFNAIRVVSMQLSAIGVRQDRTRLCLRYAVLSAHFLIYDLECMRASKYVKEEKWNLLMDTLEKNPSIYSTVLPEEKSLFASCSDRPGQMWLLISSLLGRMAADGDIPAIETAAFARLMQLAQLAQEGLRTIRNSVVVQTPYIYVHMLACLVHLNCILLACNLGLAVGTSAHGIREYMNHYYYDDKTVPEEQIVPLTTLIQTLIVEVAKGFFAPVLYQAFFDIGISISSPFLHLEAAVPVGRFMEGIEQDLLDSERLAESPPTWTKFNYTSKRAK